MGGREPYSFTCKGALPPGLNLSAGSILSGTPTEAGYFNFTVLARAANRCVGTRAYAITIAQGNREIGFNSRANGGRR